MSGDLLIKKDIDSERPSNRIDAPDLMEAQSRKLTRFGLGDGLRYGHMMAHAKNWPDNLSNDINRQISVLTKEQELMSRIIECINFQSRLTLDPNSLFEFCKKKGWADSADAFFMTLQAMCRMQFIKFSDDFGWRLTDYGHYVKCWKKGGFYEASTFFSNHETFHHELEKSLEKFHSENEGANALKHQQIEDRTFDLALNDSTFSGRIGLFIDAISVGAVAYGERNWRIEPKGLIISMSSRTNAVISDSDE